MLAKESHLKSETYSYNSQNRLCESFVIDCENKAQSAGHYSYDAFGSLVQGDLSGAKDLGYLGKQFDKATGLYNYGYRDYSPSVARFTTVDPIRDGTNWFVYCDGDSVNFVDLDGRASILQRTINDSTTNSSYHLAHLIGETTKFSPVLHGLVDRGQLGGFKEKNSVYQYSDTKSGFTTDDISSKTHKYIIRYTDMDDSLTDQAAKNVLATERFGAGINEDAKTKYKIFKNDCNDFTSAVLNEYKRLWRKEYKDNNPNKSNFAVWKAWSKHYRDISRRNGEVYNESKSK